MWGWGQVGLEEEFFFILLLIVKSYILFHTRPHLDIKTVCSSLGAQPTCSLKARQKNNLALVNYRTGYRLDVDVVCHM